MRPSEIRGAPFSLMATSSNDVDLLFRIRADAAGVKTATAEAKAAVAQLRQSFGPELAASIGVGQKALQSLAGSVEGLISQRLPLLGNVAVSVSSGLRQVAVAAAESRASVDGAGLSFAEIGAITRRTEAQVAGFVTSLGLLKTEAAKNTAVVGFLGGALASNLRPQLDEAAKSGAELNKIFRASGKSTDEALRLVQALGLIGDATQRSAAAVAFFGEATARRLLPQLEKFGASLGVIAAASGRSGAETAEFVARFARLGTEVEKRTAAVEFFGASLATKLGPELAKTSAALGGVSTASAAAGGSIAALAGPVGIAVLAVAALSAVTVIAAKEIFELTKNAAAFQGRMADLAQQTGLAVSTLSALEVLAKRTGGELGTIVQAVVLFERKLDDAQDPLSKTAELFRKFNVDTSDTETSLRSAFSALAAMPEGFAQTNAAAELFGQRGGKQVLAILKETNGDIDGTIKRLREMGVLISEDAARAADIFNDELALLEFQLRALSAAAAEDLIPVMVEIIQAFGDMVTAVRPLVSILSSIAGTALRPVAQAFKGLSLVVQALTLDYKGLTKAIKESRDAQNIPALKVPEVTPVPLPAAPTPRQAASDAANEADAVVAIVKRSVAEQNQALDELFQRGRRNRQQQAEEVIAGNKRILEADKQRIDAQLTLKEQEIKALDEAQIKRGEIVKRDTENYRAITREIGKLQQERLDKESEFDVSSRAIRAKAAKENADSRRNQIANDTDLLANEFDRQIRIIEAEIARGARVEEVGLTIIEQLERAKIDARIESLESQRQVGLLSVQDQIDLNNELKKLEQQRDRLEDDQRSRRLARDRAAAERTRDILIANLETLIQLEQIAGERRTATITALAQQRVITEEEAARQILRIRLDLIDDEIEATKAKLAAAASITDKDERIRTQAELNNQIRVLTEQRKGIQDEGNREIDEGRQRDLENEQRYADEMERIRERIIRTQRDAARTVIDLMILNFARRKDVIRAQAELEIRDAEDRHRRNRDDIRRDQSEARERVATLQGFITSLDLTSKREISLFAESVQARVDALSRQQQLNAQEQAELAQHQATLTALRNRSTVQDYQEAIQARVFALERSEELNIQEQEELRQHQSILEALRQRAESSKRIDTLQARVDVLRQQRELNAQEQSELERHQAELKRIREQDTVETSIRLRIQALQSQKVLNAQEQAELKRHVAVLAAIREGETLESAVRARIQFLESQKTLNAQEAEELKQHRAVITRIEDRSKLYADALQQRINALQKQKELNAEEKAELERHLAELERIKREAAKAKALAGPGGGFDIGLNTGQLAELKNGVQEFADVARVAFSAVGAVVNGLAQGVGNLVQQWVLLGTTGPGAFRKLVASVLAGVAAQAATLAVMELAYGIAALTPWGAAIYGPAAAHFKAALLFGSVAVASGLAGRAVAGGLFQSGAGGAAGGGANDGRSGELNPLNLARNSGTGGQPQIAPQIQPQRMVIEIRVNDSKFGKAITGHIVDDVNNAGPIREVLGGDGNLNRG